MATFTVEDITESGLGATYNTANSAGDDFKNTPEERVVVHVKNGDTASHTVTVAATDSSEDFAGWGTMTKSDISVSVAAGGEQFIGPFPIKAFGNAPTITYSSTTGITVAVLRVPKV